MINKQDVLPTSVNVNSNISASIFNPSLITSLIHSNSSNIEEDRIRSYEPFENLSVTTTTLVISLDKEGMIDLDPAFGLLPIYRMELPLLRKITQKFKLPHCKIPGSILSMRYKGTTKGIIRSLNKKSFKNSITIDISTHKKNVSLKLSRGKIQMCGASSIEQGVEGASYVISYLNRIQEDLDYLKDHPDQVDQVLLWLKQAIRGSLRSRSNPDLQVEDGEVTVGSNMDPGTFRVSDGLIDPEDLDYGLREVQEPYPENLDSRVIKFLLQYRGDFDFYSDYCAHIDWAARVKAVITRPVKIDQVCTAMVNYNYDLGFDVRRDELKKRINGLNGFYARFDSTVEHNVTIELPYEVPAEHRLMRRKNKKPCHTFLVYMSGLVTQSGPGAELMRDAYYRFMETINQIRPFIIKAIPRKIRYRRIKRISPTLEVQESESKDSSVSEDFSSSSESSSIEASVESSEKSNFPAHLMGFNRDF